MTIMVIITLLSSSLNSNAFFQIISGQYVCQNYSTNVQVEVEVIGIPVDCAKQKTKVVPKNALNPIWNDIFTFQVSFQSFFGVFCCIS